MKDKQKPRSLRTTVLLLVGVVMAVFVVVFVLVLQVSLTDLLLDIEANNISTRLDVVKEQLLEDNIRMQKSAEDIGYWPETIAFIDGENDEYLTRNWPIASPLEYFYLNFLIIEDTQDNTLLSEYYDLSTESLQEMPEGLIPFVRTISGKIADKAMAALENGAINTDFTAHGIMLHSGRAFAVAVVPVTVPGTSDIIHGTVTVGNFLNRAYFEKLSQMEDHDFSITLYDEETGTLPADGKTAIERPENSLITASTRMEDINGRPICLSVTTERSTFMQAQKTIFTTIIILLSLTTIFVLAMYFISQRGVVMPLRKLSHDIQDLEASQGLDPSKYTPPSAEFLTLCESINDLVHRLDESGISLSVFDHILNGMDAFVYVSDPVSGEVLFVNDRMREHFGIRGDCIGRPCWTLLEGQQTDRCAYCPLPELSREPDRIIVWEEQNRSTGRFYRNTDTLINWIEGRKAHLHHRVDITDMKEAQAALTQELGRQQIMSDVLRGFITNRDVDGLINETLRRAGEFIGAGRTLVVAYDADKNPPTSLAYEWANQKQDLQPLGSKFRPFAAGSPVFDAIVRDGKPFLAISDIDTQPSLEHMRVENASALLTMPVMLGDGLWGIMAVGIFGRKHEWAEGDIHLFSMIASIIAAVLDRKTADDALMRMSYISEGSPNFIAYVNNHGRFEYINDGARGITGYSLETLRSGGMDILFDDDARESLYDVIFPRVHKEGQCSFELPFYHESGERRILSFSAFTIPLHRDDIGIIGTDITEQRQMEKDILAAKEEAERSNQAKSDFLSRMSHEMRTPMNAIIGMTNMAQGTQDPEKKEYCLEKISEASSHLLGVINDILDMSKIEANKFELSFTEFNFEKMLQKVTNISAFRVDEKNQNLIINLDQSIPRTVISDEQRLAQVITNLLSNATKFTPEGGTIRLTTRLLAQNGDDLNIEFDVSDTGIGITPEQQSRLFRSFEQADGGISRKFGGTGLGLAISKRIVEMMGGDIYVTSEEGHGSSFIFHIQATRGKAPAYPQTAGLDLTKLSILAVDDAPEVREYFLSLSEKFGFPVDVAQNGFDACRLIDQATKPYDMAFIDWKMPEMDGLELTRRIKGNPDAPTTVIMISAAEWNEVEEQAKDAGVDRFIPKPLFASVIVDCINQTFGNADYKSDEEPTEKAAQTARYEGKHILLAEDIEINREIVLSLLEQTGVAVEPAENGVIVLEKFRANPDLYDLIFMDIHMPEMDGYEATRRIRALDVPKAKTVPIVAMTANVFREDIERCLAAGMNDHIGKPIDIDEFFTKLAKNMPK